MSGLWFLTLQLQCQAHAQPSTFAERYHLVQIESLSSPFEDGDVYDSILGNLDFGVDYYRNLALEAKGPVLEIGCGTGRLLIPCLQAGVAIEGLDLARPMLERLRRRTDDLGLRPQLYEADMRDFKLPKRYRFIFIACNSFNHNLTQHDQIRCLQRCRDHLEPGGLLAVETFVPTLDLVGMKQGERVLEIETTDPNTGRHLRVWDTRSFDRVTQIQHSITDVEFYDPTGKLEKIQRSEFDVRWIYKSEFELLLRAAGFPRWEVVGGYENRPLVSDDQQPMIGRAWNGTPVGV
jgi:SAM-dependent methyltransferase